MRIAEAVSAISHTVQLVAKRAVEASQASFKQSVNHAAAQPIVKGVAAGKTIEQVGRETGLTRERVIAQLTAAGYEVTTTDPASDNGDVRKTVIRDPSTGKTVTEYYDFHHDNYTTQVTEPGASPTSSPLRDGSGRQVTTSFDAKTGAVTTRTEDDLGSGTIVESTRLADGTVITKTTRKDGTSETAVTAPDGSTSKLLPGQDPTRQGTQPIIADFTAGKSIDQIASERGLSREQVIAQLRAAGYEVATTTAATENGVSTTAIRDPLTGKTITEHAHPRDGTHDVTVTDPSGKETTSSLRDGQGRKITTSTNATTGAITTHTEDDLGDGTVIETTRLPDGTTTEKTTTKDGKSQTVVTSADGKKTVLAADQTPTRAGTQSIVQDLAQGKSIDQIAKEHGWTTDQVNAQLAAAGLEVSTTEPTGDSTRTTIIDKHTGKVIASHRADYRHNTESTHYVDAKGNDVTRTVSTDGTVNTTVVSPAGRKTETTTKDGQTTTDVTFNGYTLTTAPDGSMTLHDDTTGTDLQIKKGSVEEALAKTLMSVDPNSSNPEEAKAAKVIKSLLDGIFAGQALPDLLKAAQQAGIDKDALIAKYGPGNGVPGWEVQPTRDDKGNVIDPYGKPPTTPAPSGGTWVAMNVDGKWYWVDSAVAKAIIAEQNAIAKLGQAQAKAGQAQAQLDVYLLDPAYKGAVDAARTTINKKLRPFELEWQPKKPEGTLADAQARLTQANTVLSQITAARGEYDKAAGILDKAIASGSQLGPVTDPTLDVAAPAGTHDNRELKQAQDLAANAAVRALFADINLHMSQGDGFMGDSMITLTGTAEAPKTTLPDGVQPVEITIGGRTLKVAPDVAQNYQDTGSIDVLTKDGKKIGIEIEVTNADGSKSKKWLWVDPELALFKIQSDSQIELAGAYANFYRAHSVTAGAEVTEVDLKQSLLAEYNSKHQFLFEPGKDHYTGGGDYLGKFTGQTLEVRNGELWVINHFKQGDGDEVVREEQLTVGLNSNRFTSEYRDRPLNQEWQELMTGTDSRLCNADGLPSLRGAEAVAGRTLNDLLNKQIGFNIADLDKRITGLHGEYLNALTKYGAGSLTPPEGALPPGTQPVSVDAGGTTIKVAPDVAARLKQGESLVAIGQPVWIEISLTREDGSKYTEGRWVDPHLAVLQLQANALQAQRTAMVKLSGQVQQFSQWHDLRAKHPELLDTENSTVEKTYLDKHQAEALNSIFQPRFESLLGDDIYANEYRPLKGRELNDTVARTLGLDDDSGAVTKVVDEIRGAGGDTPEVRVVPIFYVDDTIGTQQTALFAVKDGDKVVYVDANGQKFDNLKDFQDNNRQFSEHGKLVLPTNLEFEAGPAGKVSLDVVKARNVSTMDKIVDPVVGVASGVSAVLGLIPTPASPFLLGAAAAGGGYLGVRAVVKEVDYLQHGGELLDGESLMNLGMVATVALPEVASVLRTVGLTGRTVLGTANSMRWWQAYGATKGMVGRQSPLAATTGEYMRTTGSLNRTARDLDWAAIGTGVPLMAVSAHDLAEHGDQMSTTEELTAFVGLFTGLVGTTFAVDGLVRTAPGAPRRTADLNYLEPGSVTVDGRVVHPGAVEVPISPDAFLVLATKDNLIPVDWMASDIRGHAFYNGQDVVLMVCGGGTRERQPGAFVPTSYARELGNRLGTRVHAVDGDINLGDTITLTGPAVTELPGLPLTDISGPKPHRQANHGWQQRFWFGDRGDQIRVDDPFNDTALARGARVATRPVDTMHLNAPDESGATDPMSLIDQAVHLVPFTSTDPLEAMRLIEPQFAISPDYNNLGLAGMTGKWMQEIADGTRMAYVIYPAIGSRLPREPLGIIAVHREALIGPNYRGSLPDGVYEAKGMSAETSTLRNMSQEQLRQIRRNRAADPTRTDLPDILSEKLLEDPNYLPARRQLPVGRKPDGSQEPGLTRAQLEDLGEVWLFSTYLVPERTNGRSAEWPIPRGVVNRAARMKLMTLAAEESMRRGEGIPAFYSRIHAGGAYPVGSDGVQIVVDKKGAAHLIAPEDDFHFTDLDDGSRELVWNDVTRTVGPDDTANYLKNPPTHAIEFNGPSIGSQQSLTDSGPIAFGLEDGSPFPGQGRRFLVIFRVDPGHHVRADEGGNVVLDGPGAQKWLGELRANVGADTGRWTGPAEPYAVDYSTLPEPVDPATFSYTSGKDPGEFTYTTLQDFRDGKPIPPPEDPSALNPTIYLDPGASTENLDGVNVVNFDGAGGPIQPAVAKRNPVPEYWKDGLTAEKAYARYLREKEYYTPQEMAARYGPNGMEPPRKIPDVRLGTTVRTRLNFGGGFGFGSIPFGSPTLRSRSFGISARSDFQALGQAARFSIEQGTTRPLRVTGERELSLAVRPDEWRQTTGAQWGVLPASNWTILPVFGPKLIGLARATFFGKADPGWTMDIHSARVIGVTPRRIFRAGPSSTTAEPVNVSTLPLSNSLPEGSGHVVEIDFHPQIVAPKRELADGELDFFGGTAERALNGHVELQSSIPYDRVMQDIRVAPYLPGVTQLLNLWLNTKGIPTLDIGGASVTFTPGGERRQQILLNDSVGKGDVVPKELTEQFNATASGSTMRLQVAIKAPEGSDPTATYVSDFLENPTIEGLRTLVEKGYVDPEEAMFFLPDHGSNFHQTAIPGKPLTTTITDLTGRTYDVPDPSTSNLWMIFNDRWSLGSKRFGPEQAISSGIYKAKQKIGEIMPGDGPRRVASPHQLPVDNNILDGWFGANRDRADPSYRRTLLFGLPYFRYGPVAWNAEIRLQYGSEAPAVAPVVRDAGMVRYPLSPDGSGAAEVPAWFVHCIDQVLDGPTPVMPKGGTAQIHAFLTSVEGAYPEQAASVALFREKFIATGIIGDGKYLRRADAQAMVEVLPGLRRNGGDPQGPGRQLPSDPKGPDGSGPGTGPRSLADNPPRGWEPLGASQSAQQEGGAASPTGDDAGPQSLSAAYHRAAPPPADEPNLTGLPSWATTQSDAFRPYDTVAMHRSVFGWDLAAFEANLVSKGVTPETARRLVTQLGEGIENRTVRLEPFDARSAETLFPLLGKGIQYSPEYRALGPDGMTQKWLDQMAEGTRYAYVIYPAAGSPLAKEPIGMIAFHKEPLLNEHYVSTVPASEYPGRKPAGTMTKQELDALGPVWQSSTYLVQSPKDAPYSPASNNPYPKGVVNRASRMATFLAITQAEARGGERIEGFYARVHAGPDNVNAASLGSQESLTGQGPIAVVLESTSPTPGETSRYVAIFRTPAERYLRMDEGGEPAIDGPGGYSWRVRNLGSIREDPNRDAWLGNELALTDFTPASIRWPGGGERPATSGDSDPPPGDPTTLPQGRRGDPFLEVGKRVDPEFSAKLVNHILSQGGIPFADYMNLALYGIDGQGGYYNSGLVRIGEPGAADFTTAPETSKYFGRTIADTLLHMYDTMGRPARFDVVEMGAGNGVLARDVLDKLRAEHPDFYQAARYVIVERGEALVARQRTTLADHPRVSWVHASADALPLKNVRGVLLSNELVDAFPVHRAVVRRGDLKEIFVTVDGEGRLVETERDTSPELAAVLPDYLRLFPLSERREGSQMTINARSVHWMRRLAASLDEGYVLTIDYGEVAATVSTPPYVSYRTQNMPVDYSYRYPGAIDITSHVDFVVLSEVGSRAGLSQANSLGAKWLYTQQEFLRRYGLPGALRNETDAFELERGNRLLHRFGEGFSVLLQEKRAPAVAEPEPMSADKARAMRHDNLRAFVDANLLYPASTRDEIPTISVAVADPGHFSAFGKSMTPHEFLLHDEVHRSWLGNDAHGPLVLDIVDPSPAATALAQRLSNVSGADIIVPMADAPTQWQILHPTYGGAHPSGTVELSSDGTMVLLQGTERRAVQPEDLGQLLGVGVSKTAFRLYDKVLVIHRRDSDPQIVNANNPIKRQLDAVDMLRRWGAPYIASTAGRTEILGLDATLMDFYPGHSIEAGHETPSGEMFYATDVSLINENSLSSLLEMRNFYTRMGVGVDDPQFMMDRSGHFYLNDFSWILPSNTDLLASIDRWIEMAETVMQRRQSPGALPQ